MELWHLLMVLALGWHPAASGNEAPAPDLSEYVYLHVTRGEAAPPALSCRAKVQPIRN